MRTPAARRALCSTLALCLAGCGSVAVRVPVMRPAEINMAPYSSVGLGEFKFRGNTNAPRAVSDATEEALVNSQRFQVLDRQRMGDVMKELQLSSSDLANPDSAKKLGKLITAGAIVSGEVEENYHEQASDDRSQDKDNKVHVAHRLLGEARVHCTFKIVDVATGRLLIAKQYEEKRADTNFGSDEHRPAPIDREGLLSSARRALIDRFMKAIVPHQEYQVANFEKDGDIPQLEGGIGWAERGEWQKAQDAFTQAINDSEKNPKIKSSQLAKAYGDLALAYGYNGQYDKAMPMFDKAYTLNPDNSYLNARDQIKQLQSDTDKVKSQLAPSGGEGVN